VFVTLQCRPPNAVRVLAGCGTLLLHVWNQLCDLCCVRIRVCSLISRYRCRWVTVMTCVSAFLGGSASSVPRVAKRSRPMFCAWCLVHLSFVWCHGSCDLVSRYRYCFVWCSGYQAPRVCSMLPSCANSSVIDYFHAFHAVGLCCTGHSHMLLRVLCLCSFITQDSKVLPLLSAMSDAKNTWR
jgi:hypothetical protein